VIGLADSCAGDGAARAKIAQRCGRSLTEPLTVTDGLQNFVPKS
jgi:hypothetical protein